MNENDLVEKRRPTPLELRSSGGHRGNFVERPPSYAYLSRMLYATGTVRKKDLVQMWSEAVKFHQKRLDSLRAGNGMPGETLESRERELQRSREALDELNDLPEDTHGRDAR